MDKKEKQHPFLEAMDKYTLTRTDFEINFKKVLNFVVKLKEKNQSEFTALNKSISDLSEKLKGDNTSNLSSLMSSLQNTSKKELFKLAGEYKTKVSELDERIKMIKDGEDGQDADVEEVARKALELIQDELRQDITQSGEAIKGEFGEKMKDILGLFSGRGKLKAAIKKLRKEIEELKRMRAVSGGGGSSGGIGGHIRYYDLSSKLDGSTRTFALPAFARVVDVKLSSVPVLRLTTDYTIDGSNFTITFTAEISDNQIASGQSCWILYANQ